MLDPGSEWRLHRLWFEPRAMGDLLGADCRLVEKKRCLVVSTKCCPTKNGRCAIIGSSAGRTSSALGSMFLLYELTSPYVEATPPEDEHDARR